MQFYSKEESLNIEKEQIRKVEARIAAHQSLQLQNEKYIIRAFMSYDEIVEEGEALVNAIADYAKQRYSNGDDYLFLFRKADAPDIPYGALEFGPDGKRRIAQREKCYPLTDPDELAFIERFQREIMIPYVLGGQSLRKYTNPEANGFIMEAKACEKIEKDLRRLVDKYAKAVKREDDARKQQFQQVMQYRHIGEIQDDYGWEIITEKQYELFVKIFEEGEEALKNHPKTVNEIAHSILCTMCGAISRDRMQWEFEALSPEEQEAERKRAEESNKKWKAYIADLKKKRGIIETTE